MNNKANLQHTAYTSPEIDTESQTAFFCVCDERMIIQSLITLCSVMRFHPKAGYFLVSNDANIENTSKIAQSCGITFLYLDDKTYNDSVLLSSMELKWPRQCFWHFFVYRMLYEMGYQFSCCMDCDVICVNPIPFKEVFFDDKALSAVVKKDKTINSGILYLNNKILAGMHYDELAVKYYKGAKSCSHKQCAGFCREKGDQEMLFELLKHETIPWQPLDVCFNFILHTPLKRAERVNLRMINNVKEAIFLHIIPKPWLGNNAHALPTLYPLLKDSYMLWNEIAEETLKTISGAGH